MTANRSRVRFLAVCVALFAAACSSVQGGTDTMAVTGDPTGGVSATATPSTTTQATTMTTLLAPQAEPLLTGARSVIQITPTEGVGLRPTLDWEAIEGAGTYFLVVKDEQGAAYWAWEGSATSILLGGAEFPQDYGNGPTIGPGYLWSVSAYAADGMMLAISGDRPISP